MTELEGLRGILSVWVITRHMMGESGLLDFTMPWPFTIVTRGAVDTFFILSGFVTFFALDRSAEPYGIFLKRRFWRIYPAYLVTLILAIGVAAFTPAALAALPWAQGRGIAPILDIFQATWAHWPAHLAAHLTLVHGLLPDEVLPRSQAAFLTVAWTVSLTMQFYVVAPWLFRLVRRFTWGAPLLLVVAIGCEAMLPYFGSLFKPGAWVTFPLGAFLPMRLHFFLLGGLFYLAYQHLVSRPVSRHLLTGCYLALTVMIIWVPRPPLILWFAVMCAHFGRISDHAARWEKWPSALLHWAPLQFLGRISYSTFLLHMVVMHTMAWALVQTGVKWSSKVFFGGLAVTVFPLSIGLGYVCYRFVEEPALNWSKRRKVAPLAVKPVPEPAVLSA